MATENGQPRGGQPHLGHHIGRVLQLIRIMHGISEEELARRLKRKFNVDISPQAVSQLEAGDLSAAYLGHISVLLKYMPSQVTKIAESLAGCYSVREKGPLREFREALRVTVEDSSIELEPSLRALLEKAKLEIEGRFGPPPKLD